MGFPFLLSSPTYLWKTWKKEPLYISNTNFGYSTWSTLLSSGHTGKTSSTCSTTTWTNFAPAFNSPSRCGDRWQATVLRCPGELQGIPSLSVHLRLFPATYVWAWKFTNLSWINHATLHITLEGSRVDTLTTCCMHACVCWGLRPRPAEAN